MKIVEVEWLDAYTTTDAVTLADAKLGKPLKTFTVAYLMAETEYGLYLVSDRYPDSLDEGRVVNFIPWEMVVRWYYITT